MKKNSGFSSIYVLLCLSSLVLFLLCVCELCSGYAAGSICENVCLVAGKSVLSEYQPDLQRRYGVFAVTAFPQKGLSSRLSNLESLNSLAEDTVTPSSTLLTQSYFAFPSAIIFPVSLRVSSET